MMALIKTNPERSISPCQWKMFVTRGVNLRHETHIHFKRLDDESSNYSMNGSLGWTREFRRLVPVRPLTKWSWTSHWASLVLSLLFHKRTVSYDLQSPVWILKFCNPFYAAWRSISFIFTAIWYAEYSIICTFSYQWAYGLFQFFAITSTVAMSILIQASRYTQVQFPVCRNGSARPQGIWMFNFIRERKIAFQSGWPNFVPKGRNKEILLTSKFSNTWYI